MLTLWSQRSTVLGSHLVVSLKKNTAHQLSPPTIYSLIEYKIVVWRVQSVKSNEIKQTNQMEFTRLTIFCWTSCDLIQYFSEAAAHICSCRLKGFKRIFEDPLSSYPTNVLSYIIIRSENRLYADITLWFFVQMELGFFNFLTSLVNSSDRATSKIGAAGCRLPQYC